MTSGGTYTTLIAAVAIGRVSGYQIHTFRLKKLFIIANITIDNSEFLQKAIISYTAPQQLRNARVAVNSSNLSSAATFQKHANRPRATAQLQNLCLIYHMGKIA